MTDDEGFRLLSDPDFVLSMEQLARGEKFPALTREEEMGDLIDVTLDYWTDEGHVEYTRRVTRAQLGELIVKFDEMADDNEE